MTGKDFLSIAVRLSTCTLEAELRSSVSRAYYGAFHEAFAVLANFGIRLPKTAAAHDKLYQCLANSGNQELQSVAIKLTQLRLERNRADYDLTLIAFNNPKYAQMIVSIAQDIITAIDGCDQNSARSQIRDYAKRIQRLPVSDP